MSEGETTITIEIGWQGLVLLVALIASLAAALLSGAFYEFALHALRLFNVPLADLSLNRASFRRGDLVEIKVCASRWVKPDELELYVFGPGGSVYYYSGSSFGFGSEGCASVSLRLLNTVEGTHTAVIIWRYRVVAAARFNVTETP